MCDAAGQGHRCLFLGAGSFLRTNLQMCRGYGFVRMAHLSVRSSVYGLHSSRILEGSSLGHVHLHLQVLETWLAVCSFHGINLSRSVIYLQDNLPAANPRRPGIPWSVDTDGTSVVDTMNGSRPRTRQTDEAERSERILGARV